MDLPELVQQYGYLALFAGAFLEGETVVLLAGYAAHLGYLSLPTVIGIAFVASTLGDQLYYFLGRHWGAQLLARLPHWQARADRLRPHLHRHHVPLILSLRFLYGVRAVGAVVIGMAGIPPRRFILLNVIGAAVWAVSVAFAGYLIGSMLALLLEDLEKYEAWIGGAIALIGLLVWLWRRGRGSRTK